jgi:hypothetical protein
MACNRGMDTETRYVNVLAQTRTWSMQGGMLQLSGPNGLLARFSRN